jgi:membrane-associated phospholipid phosphatase
VIARPTRRFRRSSLTVVAGCLAVATWLIAEIEGGERWWIDHAPLVDLHRYRARGVVDAWLAVTQLGSYAVVAGAALVVAAWLWRRAGRPRAALFLTLAVGGEMLLGVIVKVAVHRPRPHYWHAETPTLGYSFPSAHAMNSLGLVAALLLLARTVERRRLIAALGTVYVLGVAVSRVWLGAHYPTDILGGWALSLAWVTAAAACFGGAQAVRGDPGWTLLRRREQPGMARDGPAHAAPVTRSADGET